MTWHDLMTVAAMFHSRIRDEHNVPQRARVRDTALEFADLFAPDDDAFQDFMEIVDGKP